MNKLKYAVIVVLVLILASFSLFLGAQPLVIWDVFFEPNSLSANIFFELRLPRTLLALIAGGALSGSGAAVQAVLRNPLASPDVLGVGTGASLGVLLSLQFGLAWLGIWVLPIFAFLGALIVTSLTYFISLKRGESDALSLILGGMAINAFLAGITALVLSQSRDTMIAQYIFRVIGSLENRQWSDLLIVVLPIILGLILLIFFRKDLNYFGLGDHVPRTLGFPFKFKKIFFLGISALLTGAVVSVCGAIGFVGLMIPHGIRLAFGHDYKRVIPLSVLCGGAFLLFADILARLVVIPWEMQVGIVTSILGTPFFIFLLLRYRKTHGI